MKLQEHYSLSLARNTSEQASNADKDGIITLIPKKKQYIYNLYSGQWESTEDSKII